MQFQIKNFLYICVCVEIFGKQHATVLKPFYFFARGGGGGVWGGEIRAVLNVCKVFCLVEDQRIKDGRVGFCFHRLRRQMDCS